ncbi:MAG: GtrA family protein, partial [Parvularculaceae bacterium]|nr:GtrA family protein [Parvularculaceae bacterium]
AFDLATSYATAIVLAYLVGMTTAYLLTRRFVFEPSRLSTRESFVRFALVNVVAAAQVLAVSVFLADHVFPAVGFTWRAHDVAHVAGVLFPVATSYLLHKRFSFAAK